MCIGWFRLRAIVRRCSSVNAASCSGVVRMTAAGFPPSRRVVKAFSMAKWGFTGVMADWKGWVVAKTDCDSLVLEVV